MEGGEYAKDPAWSRSEDGIKMQAHIWVEDVLDWTRKHIQPTHKHLRAVFMPASLLGTALGPEGPRCRRRRRGMGEEGTEEEGAEKETGEEGRMRESRRDGDDTWF